MSGAAVRLVNVSKRFRLGENHESVRDLIAAGIGRLLRRRADQPDLSTFWAVRDVDLEVSRGEAVGIIGPNGAGKSTILRLLAGILRADNGEVLVDGRLAALIEVGAGFHGDLTGRENVFLNGAILGMNRAEIRRKLDDIVSFAGIERFLDMPVKRYSSGMYARLGFSIAAHVDPDVLLVDEVLSVGDAVFRLRCLERMGELVRGGTTLIFVTHDLDQMQSACPRAVVLDHGGVTFNGPSREAVGHYLRAMSLAYAHRSADLVGEEDRGSRVAEVTGLRFLDADGAEVVWVRPHEPICVELRFHLRQAIPRVVVELNMRASLAESLLSVNSGRDGITCPGTVGEHTVTLTLPHVPLAGGQYFWNVRIWDVDRGVAVVDTPFRYPMAIDDQGCKTGKICLEHEWSFPKSECRPVVSSNRQAEHEFVGAGDRSEDLPAR